MPLSGKQRRALRALGHHLHPLVQVGQDGVTDGVIAAIDQALVDHELIKVKLGDERQARAEHAAALAQATGAEIAQELGRTVLFFRRKPEQSSFDWLDSKHVTPPGAGERPPSAPKANDRNRSNGPSARPAARRGPRGR